MSVRSELHDALEDGDQETMVRLLRAGANIDERNVHGWTPLMVASKEGQVDLARLLMEYGADRHAVNYEGQNALHLAAMHGCAKAVLLLIQPGTKINAMDNSGHTPLHLASAHCSLSLVIDICVILLAAGADVNARTKYGTTPLWSAAIAGRIELLEFLLQLGADVDARDLEGRTALMFVIKLNFCPDAIPILLARGSNVNAQDNNGRSALMYAALSVKTAIMRTLINSGADPTLRDAAGRTALDVAMANGLVAGNGNADVVNALSSPLGKRDKVLRIGLRHSEIQPSKPPRAVISWKCSIW